MIPLLHTYRTLQCNSITAILSSSFSTAPFAQLQYLLLDSNPITLIVQGSFIGLTSLAYLGLGSLSFSALPSGAFQGLTALTSLFVIVTEHNLVRNRYLQVAVIKPECRPPI